MQESKSRLTDRLTPVTRTAAVFGLITGLLVGTISALVLNVAAGILIGLLVIIAVVVVTSLAMEETSESGTLPTFENLDSTIVIEPVEPDDTAPEEQQP
jgi:amino acid transporter